jgi:pSer/pThr/pTyr-binding forkhead associated (FHA) protein
MLLRLLVLSPGPRQGKTIPVGPDPFLIGRAPDCQLRPASPLIAWQHAVLDWRDNKAFVRDLHTAAGTYVNGRPVSRQVELRDGDQLQVGPLRFAVRLETDAPVAPPTAPRVRARPRDSGEVLLIPLEDSVRLIAGAAP